MPPGSDASPGSSPNSRSKDNVSSYLGWFIIKILI